MRILVCGDRHFNDYEYVRNKIVENCPKEYEDGSLVVISGAARGVDTCAADFALVHNLQLLEYPADWDKYGKAAGPIRNKQMLDEGKPDLVVAFLAEGSRGTANMIKQAEEAGVTVKVINV